MTVRKVKVTDFKKLVPLFQGFFKEHNRFQQTEKEITTYLQEQARDHELLVSEENGSLQGALFLVNFGQSNDGSHKLWKWRHFAFKNEELASLLLKEAEKRVKSSSKTVKIELTIAESEPGISFYKKQGYVQEGILKDHYRWGENCFILSKSFF